MSLATPGHSGREGVRDPAAQPASPVLGVVPARMGATRLPGKPLLPLLGVPLVVWTWRRARAMACLDRVVVATDSPEVAEACRREGAEVEMTSPDHPSGSDRTWEAAERVGGDFDPVVNVQGDEPLVKADAVEGAVAMVRDGFDVGTCATPVRNARELADRSVVKVARARGGRALYFSRASIPHRRHGFAPDHDWAGGAHLRHVGVYAYRRSALKRWVALGPSPLETEEGLEQLRALEHGMRIGVAIVAEAPPGVDTPADLRRMEERFRQAERERGQRGER